MPAWGRRKGAGDSVRTSHVKREVGAQIEVEIIEPTPLEFQIAVARQPGIDVSESLAIKLNGKTIEPREIIGEHHTRIHKMKADKGILTLSYSATVVGHAEPAPASDIDMITYLRPSRYAEADKFFGFAATEFQQYGASVILLEKVSSWVGTRLNYVPGSSDPIDGAADTLLAGAGVPRLCPFGDRVAARAQRPGASGGGLRAGMSTNGFPCSRRGIRRRRLACCRSDLLSAAAVYGAHRHRPRRRRYRLPG
jgi:hypothetical protein